MPTVREACCRKSCAVLRVMACTNVWPLFLISAATLVFWYPVLASRHHTVHPNEGGNVFMAVSPKRASLEVEVDFLAPSAATGRGPRQPCNGFAQLETLKGEWVDQETGYQGINPNSTCPSFVQDFSCLSADYIDPKYKGRVEKVNSRITQRHDVAAAAFTVRMPTVPHGAADLPAGVQAVRVRAAPLQR